MKTPVIGLDLMGGDHPPQIIFESLRGFLHQLPHDLSIKIFATAEVAERLEQQDLPAGPKISFVRSETYISMTEPPLSALRQKKDSSLCLGMVSLKDEEIDAFISIGSTGALLGGSKLYLKTLPSITRPALLAVLPTKSYPLAVLDVGANVSCDPTHLVQFAEMGLAFQKCFGINDPKVGLLNIGSEKTKGRKELIEAYQLLLDLNKDPETSPFLGNIEGKNVFDGHIHVLVTDGFSGNIFLKTAEGMTSYILDRLLESELDAKGKTQFSSLAYELNPSRYPGALLCGIDKLVIKCHGDSEGKALCSAIEGSLKLLKYSFLTELQKHLKRP